MDKRILAVLIASLAGVASAQSDTNRAPANPGTGLSNKATVPGNPGATATTSNPPASPGYIMSGGSGVVVTNPYGLCWRSGADWSPDKAAAPCDAVPRASVAVPPVAQAPAAAPAPLALAPVAAPPVIEKLTLSTDVLFEFNKAQLRPGAEEKLDQLARDAQGADVDKVVVTGHADRIGSDEYNQQLSEARAQAVADYIAAKGVDRTRIQAVGKGESEPVTGNECTKLGKESNKNQKLIACLQPDRRVDAELLGSRESTAATRSSSPAGATGTGARSSEGTGANQ